MSTPTAAPHQSPQAAPRKAGTFQLVFMVYSVICSGAYGLEQMVSKSGPGMAMLSLCVLPLIWALPLTMACAELTALYPVEGGYYRWARMAFGDFTGYICGWLVWLANLATNAAFAVLFANYARYWIPLTDLQHWLVAVALIWGVTWLNHRGIRLVGATSVVFTILIFVPFFFMTLLGLLQWKFNPFLPIYNPEQGMGGSFLAGLAIAIWLYSGYEKLTTNAAEVENPSRAFPIALAFALPMTVGSYIIPTFAALAAGDNWTGWKESYFMDAAHQIGGSLLGNGMAAGGLVSDACLLMVTILGQSRLPMVLAEDGSFPRAFKRTHRRFGTPTMSLFVGSLCLSGLVLFRFDLLATLFTFVQVLAYLFIYASLLKLRWKTSGVEAVQTALGPEGGRRPFRIPLGITGVTLMMLPSLLLALFAIAGGVWHDGGFDGEQAFWEAVILASGPITFVLFRWWASRGQPARA
jgi:amino acid transporter